LADWQQISYQIEEFLGTTRVIYAPEKAAALELWGMHVNEKLPPPKPPAPMVRVASTCQATIASASIAAPFVIPPGVFRSAGLTFAAA
jgi:hypothetical protein